MPRAYIEYLLCKKFHWTINQLDQQPYDRIMEFLTIMRIEGNFQAMEQQKAEAALETKR